MPDTERKPPTPLVQSFVTCDQIFIDRRTGTKILLGPRARLPAERFPTHFPISMYVEFSGGHGSYHPRICLRDDAGEEVWGWTVPGLSYHADPLLVHEVHF